MKPYQKNYLEYFGYDKCDTIYCEVCSSVAVDLHHIQARGMGGSKLRDNVENIMALCRSCHELMGDRKEFKDKLIEIHILKMSHKG